MKAETPLISIVLATYNRSNILGFTLDCVRRQTVTNWELWVIGDACTDTTEEVVQGLGDPRIHFLNLEENSGSQAIPNNIGVSHSRGKYIAYLHHDDLWLCDHLETVLLGIENAKADFVFTLAECVNNQGVNFLHGVPPTENYEPSVFVPASLWFFKRDLFDEIGPWLAPHKCFNVPSQEWLCRAYKRGKIMKLIPQLTAILIQSGYRPNCYLHRDESESRQYHQSIVQDPKFRERELLMIALHQARRDPLNPSHTIVQMYFMRILKNILKKMLLFFGVSIPAVFYFLKYWRRGGKIVHLRKIRGLNVTWHKR